MIKVLPSIVLLTWLLSGCGHTNTAPKNSVIALPEWVFDAHLEGYEIVVGFASAQKGVFELQQHRVAELSAMRAFSEIQRVHVSNTTTQVSQTGLPIEVQSQTQLNAANALDFSKLTRLNSWVHPKTQDLYVLYGIPINDR
jgi:hypothetical protein